MPPFTVIPQTLKEVGEDPIIKGVDKKMRRALRPFVLERAARKKLSRDIMGKMPMLEWSQSIWRNLTAKHGAVQKLDLAENAVKRVWYTVVARYKHAHPEPFPSSDRPAPWPLCQPVSPPETNYRGASVPSVIRAFGTIYIRTKLV